MYNDGRDVFSTTPGPFIIVDNDDMNFGGIENRIRRFLFGRPFLRPSPNPACSSSARSSERHV